MRLWQSTKPQPQQTLTIVTALSKARLPMLEAQCMSWPGPLAVVLYEPLVVPATNTTSTTQAVNSRRLLGVNAQASASTTSTGSSTDSLHGQSADPSSSSADAGQHSQALLQQYYGQDATAEKRMVETERVIQDTFQR